MDTSWLRKTIKCQEAKWWYGVAGGLIARIRFIESANKNCTGERTNYPQLTLNKISPVVREFALLVKGEMRCSKGVAERTVVGNVPSMQNTGG